MAIPYGLYGNMPFFIFTKHIIIVTVNYYKEGIKNWFTKDSKIQVSFGNIVKFIIYSKNLFNFRTIFLF